VLPIHVLVIETPGANTSMAGPKLEKDVILSAIDVAPTVIAEAARAGLKFRASLAELPAATTM
jgi:hypothetical protein